MSIITPEFIEKYKNITPKWGYAGLGYVVYKRTYSRLNENGIREEWYETIARCVNGAQDLGAGYTKEEAERLFDYVFHLKCNFAGRMLWQLGTNSIKKFGANSLLNCWFCQVNEPEKFCFIFEQLMLGGGVGFSVRREDIHELPKIKMDVKIECVNTKDAGFIVPDSREGWVNLLRKVLRSYFINGKSFTYSTILIRGYGEPIKGFGGVASGPGILVDGITNICKIFESREGKKLRSVDVLDICNLIGSIVVSGNVRRSAQIAIGDPDDYLFLRAKRWDLGGIPNWRTMSNNTIYADDYSHITNDFWQGYLGNGEPYGLYNVKLAQKMGRVGELQKDNAVGTNPCVSGDTQILTTKGYCSIESLINIETDIWNGYNWSRVIPRVTGHNQPMLKITLSDGRVLKCTKYHTWIIAKGYKDDYEKKQAINLQIGDKIFKYSFPIIKEGISFPHAYTQGVIAGDGMDGYNFLYLYGEKIKISKRMNGRLLDPITFSKGGVERKKFRLEGDYENKEFVPLSWNLKSKLDWLAGLFDTDGCELKEGGVQVSSSNKNFLLEVQKLLSLCGANSKVLFGSEIKDWDGYEFQETWRICIGAHTIQSLITLGLKCERLKLEKNPNRDASQFAKVISIEEIPNEEEVYCFNEPLQHFGIFNGILTGQCGEITLADMECCNLSELYLNNISSKEELIDCAKLLYKTQKAICALNFIHEETNEIVHKNMRIGIGCTGICQSLDKVEWLDDAYKALRKLDKEWSKQRGWNESIKLTTVKPSGTLSLLAGATPGIHPAFSKHYIRRVRMASDDELIKMCKELGYHTEYQLNLDSSIDHKTIIVEFPCYSGENSIITKDMSAIRQLELVKQVQKVWSDNSVSVTVYYKPEELDGIKNWLKENYKNNLKSVSFLLHSEHGFKQAPLEEITEDKYKTIMADLKPIQYMKITDGHLDVQECNNGSCPIK